MIEIGRMCIKIAGRDAGLKCAIVDILDERLVLIDGETRRRKCNIMHLEPLKDSINIKKNASHQDIKIEFEKLELKARETKSKPKTERPIVPGQEFATSVTLEENVYGEIELSVPEGIVINGASRKEVKDGEIKWLLSGDEGEYLLEYIFQGKTYSKEVLISQRGYEEPSKRIKDGIVKTIEIGHRQNKLLNLFGWKVGWLGTYIIFSIIFSILVRKVVKVY